MILKLLNRGWYIFALWACRMYCVTFFRMHLIGQNNVPRKGPFVLISNHQSFLDPIFCGAPLRRQLVYVARDTLFHNWFFRYICCSIGVIPVKRGSADLSAIKAMLRKLKEGYGLCLFPEATRTADGKIASLRSGFAMLCRKTKAPIVPVVIDGAYECWPRTKKFFSPWHNITVRYGKSIPYKQASQMTDDELAEYLTNSMRKMLNESRVVRGKQPYEIEDVKEPKE